MTEIDRDDDESKNDKDMTGVLSRGVWGFWGGRCIIITTPGVQENCDQLHPELDNDLELSSFGHEHVLLSLRHAVTYGFKGFKLSSSTGIFRMLVS